MKKSAESKMQGKLYLIPTVLGDTLPSKVLPASVFNVIERLRYYIAEDIRTARRFLRKAVPAVPIDNIEFFELNKYTAEEDLAGYLASANEGHDTGLLSEAGVPCVADPGSRIVAISHRLGIKVIPLAGPSSIILALMASGLNGQAFSFLGYLPVNRDERNAMVRKLEKESAQKNHAQIFMETPYRNMHLIDTVLSVCKPSTLLCIACDITLDSEFIATKTIAEWKKSRPDINKRPAIFIIQNQAAP
jgi:16S rRNA (cytidine1402-2'-O)-methyltransferase